MNNDTNTRYNQVRQKGSHNSYERSEGLDDQEIYWRLRAIELDIHNGKGCSGRPPLNGNWYVYHYCGAGGTSTSVDKLSDGLQTLAAFARAVPDHEPMTLFIDLKDSFDSTHTPEQLDQLILGILGRDNVWGPPDLIAATGTSTLQAAIAHGGWPLLADLRGKFLIALTGGDLRSSTSKLNQYVDDGQDANQRLAFVAPEISSQSQITQWPYAIFFNLPSSSRSLGPAIFQAGLVSRTWGVDNEGDWNQAVSYEIHHLATNKVNSQVDPWASTANAKGYPFQGIQVTMDPSLAEPGSIYGIRVASGDLWGKEDSFYFAYNQLSGSAVDASYRSFISSPGSNVDDWAKGGLLARASLDAGAPYFGVIRPGRKALRVQVRTSSGGSTTAKDVAIVPPDTVDEEDLIYVRLELTNGGKTATGWGSMDGVHWTEIYSQTFSQVLAYQGWGAASHGDSGVKFLFGMEGGGPLNLGSQQAIGKGVSGSFFSGVNP